MAPDDVTAPPYDVVDADQAQVLRERSPYNIAHVEYGHGTGEEQYRAAADSLRSWQAEGVLRRDDTPSYYVYEQRFRVQGAVHRRRCFFARLRLHPPSDGTVRPHEATMAAPVEDRLNLLRATTTNVSPILGIFEDRAGSARAILDEVARTPPDFEATAGDDRHRLWQLNDPARSEALTAAVGASPITIADGHHRYATALHYLEERPSEAARWVLAGLVAVDDPGLLILPAHRLVHSNRLPDDFLRRISELYVVEDVTPKSWDGTAVQRLWGRVQANAQGPATFGALGIEEQHLHLLTARSAAVIDRAMPARWSRASRSLDVAVLTETILRPLLGIDEASLAAGEQVKVTEDVEEAWRQTERGRWRLAMIVNPVRVEQVLAVADAGELMSPKSTFFYPKLRTGMVLNPLD